MLRILGAVRKLLRPAGREASVDAPEVDAVEKTQLTEMLDLTLAASQAWRAKSWPVARDVCRTLRDSSPDVQLGYQVGVISARMLTLLDEADAILEQARKRLAPDPWMAREAALLAVARGDQVAALREAEHLRRMAPDDRTGYQVGIDACRKLGRFDDARAILTIAERKFPEQAWVATQQMRLAEATSDHEGMVRHASSLIRVSPSDPEAYRTMSRGLRRLGRLEEAAEFLAVAESNLVPQRWLYLEQAEIAQSRQAFSLADEHLSRGMEKFPDDRDVALAYAVRPGRHITERRQHGGGEKSVRRLQELCAKEPDLDAARAALAEELCKSGQFDAANALFEDRPESRRKSERCALAWAKIAELMEDNQAAVERAFQAAAWFPDSVTVHANLAIALARGGAPERASQVVAEAIGKFSPSLPVLEAKAIVAEHMDDYASAVQIWEKLVEDFPGVTRLNNALASARKKAIAKQQ